MPPDAPSTGSAADHDIADQDIVDRDPVDHDGLDHDALAAAVRTHLSLVLDPPLPEDELAPDGRLVDDYGLTSLNRVLFLTSLCDDTGVPVSAFTEVDLARMVTVEDVVTAFATAARATVTP